MKHSKDIVIVGAGPGGLAAAIQLATAGFRVRVLEKMATPGGRTSALTAEGFRFDLGPTFFLYPQILDEILRAAGTSLESEVEMVRLDPQYRIQFGSGGRIDATPDVERMREQIAAISPEDAGGFERFLADNRQKFRGIRGCLEKPFLGWGSLLAKEVVASLPYIRPWESVDGYLHRFFRDERVRLAFSFQSKYLGMSPFRCPSLFSILSYLEYDYGVWHPMGGCSAVSEAMARVAKRLGVEICYNEPVVSLAFEGRRVIGVRTGKRAYRADAVVTNADFAHAMRNLVPNQLRHRWSDEQIETKQFSCSTFMLYLGIEGNFAHMPHHTIQISPNYRENLRQIEDDKVIPTEPSFYVQNACVTDPGLAPRGSSTLYVLAPVPHRSEKVDWKTAAPQFREKLLQCVEKAGFEGVRNRIRFEKQVTPDDWEHNYAIHKGATFNLAHSLTQMLHWRPRNRFEDLEGMYLVGGGTHPGSGLPVIYEGARITSRLVCEDFGVSLPGAGGRTASTPDLNSSGEPLLNDWQAAARVASGV
jgi:phytoene desaturase